MDGFALFIVFLIVAMVLVFLAIGKWFPGSGAEVLDWKPTRSPETEVELEQDDVQQMIDAQNERRRRTGRPERSEDEVRAEVAAAQDELRRRREAP